MLLAKCSHCRNVWNLQQWVADGLDVEDLQAELLSVLLADSIYVVNAETCLETADCACAYLAELLMLSKHTSQSLIAV